MQRQVDENKQPKSKITVGQAIEQWLDVAALEPTTRERYDDLIRLYVLPTFGSMQAGKLDAELLERFYARLQRCRELWHRPGARRSRLPATEFQHDTQGALHPPRRLRPRRAVATPRREPSRDGRGAGAEQGRARPAQRHGGGRDNKIELDRLSVIRRIADALDVTIGDLVAEPTLLDWTADSGVRTVPALRQRPHGLSAAHTPARHLRQRQRAAQPRRDRARRCRGLRRLPSQPLRVRHRPRPARSFRRPARRAGR